MKMATWENISKVISMTRYKYWFFYIKPKYEEDVYKELYHRIYAYTDNKDYAREFELFHDMCKFIKKEILLSREEVRTLTRHAKKEYLQPCSLTTSTNDSGIEKINLIITEGEQQILTANVSNMANNTIIRATVEAPYIFNKKIYKALKELKYILLYSGMEVQDSFMNGTLHIDEFAVYVNIFSNVLRKKKGDE